MRLKDKEAVEQGLNHDWEIHIATASSRKSTNWRNGSTTVADFVRRLSSTVRTAETVEQFARMPKPEQDHIKDVGGFVGGLLKAGRRTGHAVANRQLLTLDMDHAPRDALDKIRDALPGVCWSVYSTHKHSSARPRLRLIVYPDRPTLPDEYQPAMRKIADKVGIDFFDHTTYQTNRMMYWPSTPSDGEFLFQHNDAPPLAVDALLAEYGEDEAWKDISLWPIGSAESGMTERKASRQADPLTKKGVVGAVCRVIPIREAISEYLGDVYRHESGGRYSFLGGTTSSGLVIYDEKFAYSNHESDPAFGQLLNTFDLLRVHLFGAQDDEVAENTPANRLPSYRAMVDWARDNKAVKTELVSSGLEIDSSAFDVFEDVPTDDGEEDEDRPEWMADLQIAENGIAKSTFFNATMIMQKDVKVRGLMRFNEFSMTVENAITGENWSAPDSYKVRKYIGRKYQTDFPESKIEQAIEDRAHANSYHPIRDYLQSLEWDGEERLETILIDTLGAEDSLYVREATKCWFAAAVYRVMEPGYKHDTALVLGGPQGIGKTSFLQIIGKGDWYGELSSFDNKVAMEEIGGKWIIEISEMGATNRHEIEQQKAFLSATVTRARPAYAKHPVDYKRQCVFCGTTNQDEYLKDSTGNRRFWPIDCGQGEADLEGLRKIVDLLWAEAFYLYAMDSDTQLSPEARKAATQRQEAKRESDPWEGVILEWLESDAPKQRYDTLHQFDYGDGEPETEVRDRVCALEIWEDCLKMRNDIRQHDRRRIAAIMRNADLWESHQGQIRFGSRFGRQKGWVKVVAF